MRNEEYVDRNRHSSDYMIYLKTQVKLENGVNLDDPEDFNHYINASYVNSPFIKVGCDKNTKINGDSKFIAT